MHKGLVLPISEKEKERWLKMQNISDQEDEAILSSRVRISPVEKPLYVNNIVARSPKPFGYPKHQSCTLTNGLKLLYCNRTEVEMVELILDLKAKSYYDPDHLQGLALFVSRMMLEGTQNYTGQELAQEIESLGMSISVSPGVISMSMLSQDLERGLQLLEEILARPLFEKKAVEKIRLQLLAELDEFWDKPTLFVGQLARQHVYAGHPFAKNRLGTAQSLANIDQKDLVDFHQKLVSPEGARLAVVGDLGSHNVENMMDEVFANWKGPDVFDMQFPSLKKLSRKMIDHPIGRDQVVLCYAGLSVSRTDSDYDKLLVFDQLFSGGVSGALSCRLFELRERTGLFYTIGGSLVAGATEQPGMVVYKTIVSLDDLPDAEGEIEEAIQNGTKNITEQEFVDAQNGLVNSLVNNFESNEHAAQAFLFLERYHLPLDYFDKRAEQLLQLDLDSMVDAVQKILQKDLLIKLRVGRF
ncbi:M16 family metallopeptidase [Candidatus Dependentiae bacterium]